LDLFSVALAALGHDVGHPGVTNRYLINNRDPLAIQYNDYSVLENMHCSQTFAIMNKPGCDILKSLLNNDWVSVRKLIIEMIMQTDMSKHFEILIKFRTRAIVLSDLAMTNHEDKANILAMGLKCADIGHSAKDISLHLKWTNLVCEEFFAQGDMEKQKKQAVSMYCDRDCTDIPKSQMGFIKNICLPLFEVWCKYLNSDLVNNTALESIKKNMVHWEAAIKKRKGTVMVYSNSNLSAISIKRRQSEF
jgi:3'5'-cyclic nucleotide phosphodiesterase